MLLESAELFQVLVQKQWGTLQPRLLRTYGLQDTEDHTVKGDGEKGQEENNNRCPIILESCYSDFSAIFQEGLLNGGSG